MTLKKYMQKHKHTLQPIDNYHISCPACGFTFWEMYGTIVTVRTKNFPRAIPAGHAPELSCKDMVIMDIIV